MSLSSIPHFTCVNHDFWPSFANCRRAKDSTIRTPADTASVFLGISTGALRHSNYILTTRLGTTLSLFFVVLVTKFPNLVQKKKSALPGDPCFKTAESLFFHPLTLKIRYETLNPHLPFTPVQLMRYIGWNMFRTVGICIFSAGQIVFCYRHYVLVQLYIFSLCTDGS